jgi:hypothetical protein
MQEMKATFDSMRDSESNKIRRPKKKKKKNFVESKDPRQ